ncbi:MAG: YceI family protein [Chitinophagales bacterium]|nr:YceI family protein [Chitinophagales bacterium]
MKKMFLLSAASCALLCMAFVLAPSPHVDVYKLDIQTSSLEWHGKKLTGEHNGAIKFLGGQLSDNHGAISGKFDVDMSSIVVNDLQGESKTKLENHLKSADFFDSKLYPKATFAITSLNTIAAPDKDGNTHTISGNMTIRDKTNPVSFNAKFAEEAGKLRFTGTAVIDRSKYDVQHRSKSFFPEIGDKIVYDEFTMKFNVALTKAQGH